MIRPFAGFAKRLAVVRAHFKIGHRTLAAGAAEMIDDLVLENADEPGALRRLLRKIFGNSSGNRPDAS